MSPEQAQLATYLGSMPADYRKAFDRRAIRAHAAIVRRRGERPAHVELWQEREDGGVAICVVADDKPGLFTCISSALVAAGIDIVSVNAYCRTRADAIVEAVDILWIRRLADAAGFIAPLGAKDVVELAVAIERAVGEGALSRRVPAPNERPGTKPSPSAAVSARIRFETDAKDGSTVLTVEAVDRPGLLLAVTQALFRANLQIIALRATTERGSAVDRFHLAELDGSALRRERLLTLQAAILGALEVGALAPRRQSVG